jgi:hypothetical protein
MHLLTFMTVLHGGAPPWRLPLRAPRRRCPERSGVTRGTTGRTACKWLVALIVSSDGFARCNEVFEGNRRDVTAPEEVLEKIETKYGCKRRVWVFDRRDLTPAVGQFKTRVPPVRFCVVGSC